MNTHTHTIVIPVNFAFYTTDTKHRERCDTTGRQTWEQHWYKEVHACMHQQLHSWVEKHRGRCAITPGNNLSCFKEVCIFLPVVFSPHHQAVFIYYFHFSTHRNCAWQRKEKMSWRNSWQLNQKGRKVTCCSELQKCRRSSGLWLRRGSCLRFIPFIAFIQTSAYTPP